MKSLKLGGWTMAAMTMAVAMQVAAQSTAKRVIVVSLEDHKLALLEDGSVTKIYTVAVGKPSTPSPEGSFSIERRAKNPTYMHDGKTIPPGPGNPVGTRWMGLSVKGYGIHGTNDRKSIGKAASHGCIRMAKADLEEFYELVAVGDTVEIVGRRNEQIAEIFGEAPKPAPASVDASLLLAQTEALTVQVPEEGPVVVVAIEDTPAIAAKAEAAAPAAEQR